MLTLTREQESIATAAAAMVRRQFQTFNEHAKPRLNVDVLLRALARGIQNHEQARYCEAVAERNGVVYDPARPFIEFRDLTVAGMPELVSAGDGIEASDILRPYSVLTQLGLDIQDGLVGDTVVPDVSATSTANWLSSESDTATPSQPTLTGKTLTPHAVSAVIQFSRQLSKQANAESFVRRELLRTIGTAVDQAILGGASPNGPDGLFYASGVQMMSGQIAGSSPNYMAELSANANAMDEQITFVATPTVRRILQTRPVDTGTNYVWEHGRMGDHAARVTTNLPAASLVCGPWPMIFVGIWGTGFQVEVNPYHSTLFRSGVIQARLILSCDVAVRQPNAFVWASSVS